MYICTYWDVVTAPEPYFCFPQGILAAVLSAVLGTKDPDQVSTMAKQAGEVSYFLVYSFQLEPGI